jgi:hypothetical protein
LRVKLDRPDFTIDIRGVATREHNIVELGIVLMLA